MFEDEIVNCSKFEYMFDLKAVEMSFMLIKKIRNDGFIPLFPILFLCQKEKWDLKRICNAILMVVIVKLQNVVINPNNVEDWHRFYDVVVKLLN